MSKTKHYRPGTNLIAELRFKKKVLKRDGICKMCKGTSKCRKFQIHHIRKWENYPSLRYTVWNGIILCKTCHASIAGQEELWEDFFFAQTNPAMATS